MTIDDQIYGRVFVDEAVIQEVILSKPVQRLQGLRQAGVSYYRHPEFTHTRFDHSVGVMALLQSWDASVEEQLAGLLHDVNHLAFSHVADVVFGDAQGQEFAEQFQRQVIMGSEIPEILGRYGIDPELMVNFKQEFPLLERDLPDLCADRFDYGLRDAQHIGLLNLEQVHEILDDAQIKDGQQIVFRSQGTARLFGDTFRALNQKWYVSVLDMSLYRFFADGLRLALDTHVISMEDLFLTDDEVWDKLLASELPALKKVMEYLPRMNVKVVGEGEPHDFQVQSKIRLIDPWVVSEGQLERLSILDPEFANANTEYLNSAQEGYLVKMI